MSDETRKRAIARLDDLVHAGGSADAAVDALLAAVRAADDGDEAAWRRWNAKRAIEQTCRLCGFDQSRHFHDKCPSYSTGSVFTVR